MLFPSTRICTLSCLALLSRLTWAQDEGGGGGGDLVGALGFPCRTECHLRAMPDDNDGGQPPYHWCQLGTPQQVMGYWNYWDVCSREWREAIFVDPVLSLSKLKFVCLICRILLIK